MSRLANATSRHRDCAAKLPTYLPAGKVPLPDAAARSASTKYMTARGPSARIVATYGALCCEDAVHGVARATQLWCAWGPPSRAYLMDIDRSRCVAVHGGSKSVSFHESFSSILLQ